MITVAVIAFITAGALAVIYLGPTAGIITAAVGVCAVAYLESHYDDWVAEDPYDEDGKYERPER